MSETCVGIASLDLIRSRLVKDVKGDLVAHSHSIFSRWMDNFSQLLNIHRVNDVRQKKYTQQNH